MKPDNGLASVALHVFLLILKDKYSNAEIKRILSRKDTGFFCPFVFNNLQSIWDIFGIFGKYSTHPPQVFCSTQLGRTMKKILELLSAPPALPAEYPHDMDPVEAGLWAYRCNVFDCPFSEGTEEHKKWCEGYGQEQAENAW